MIRKSFYFLLVASLFTSCSSGGKDAGKAPNFVVIFIDDMGYGDIGPFGSTINKTPELDRMANEGMRLTSFYVAAPLCTPSRAALMTGCYPKRVGLATGSRFAVLLAKDTIGLNPSEITIAEILREEGYSTGCFGKWHLGDQPEFLPTNHGFDTFFGIPYSNDIWPYHPRVQQFNPTFCPLPFMRDLEVLEIVEDMDDQSRLCKRFTDAATDFIRKNAEKPFFVYLPHASVHGPRSAPKEFMDKAEGDVLRAQIEEVDWSAGQVLETIRELGLEKNTFVIFTSDNGGGPGRNGPFSGNKGKTLEGGMREPTIVWWPGTIPANSVCDEMTTSMDLLPTFARLAGAKVPDDRIIDGKDIAPLFFGQPDAKTPHEAFFYHSYDTLKAVRSGKWKLQTDGKLFDLDNDSGEKTDAAGMNPEVVSRLEKYLEQCRADLGDMDNCRPAGRNTDPQYLVPLEGSNSSNK